MAVVNHIGLAVSNLDRSRRFYEEVLGFRFKNEMSFPDSASGRLLDIAAPVDLRVVYLERDGWVLELLTYATVLPARGRAMNEPGLTHISIAVDEVDATVAAAVAHGGTSLPDRGFPGMVAMIRDPDGQIIELLPMSYRDSL